MAKASPRSRSIDKSVSHAQSELKNKFAFVAKKRANIWLTVAGVLFVLGMGTAFVALQQAPDYANQSSASFLGLRGDAGTTTYIPTTQKPASSGFLSGFRDFFSKLAGDSGSGDSKLPGDEEPSGGQTPTGPCTVADKSGCAVVITGSTRGAQGQPVELTFTPTMPPADPNADINIVAPPSVKVDWGDGSYQVVRLNYTAKHSYMTQGSYTVKATVSFSNTTIITPGTQVESTEVTSTKGVAIAAAGSAIIDAEKHPESPSGTVTQNATNVEIARINLENTTATAQPIRALVVGCGESKAYKRTNNTAAPQPFAFNKYFSVRVGGPTGTEWGRAKTYGSARELYAEFPNAGLDIDSRLIYSCKNGIVLVKPNNNTLTGYGASAPLAIPASGTVTLSLMADIGPMDPCTELQLGVSALYETAGSPLLIHSAVGNILKVKGINPFINRSC